MIKKVNFKMDLLSIFDQNGYNKIVLEILKEEQIIWKTIKTPFDYIIENTYDVINYMHQQIKYEEGEEGGTKQENTDVLKRSINRILFSDDDVISFNSSCLYDNRIYLYFVMNNGTKTRYATYISEYNIITKRRPNGKYVKLYKEFGQSSQRTCVEKEIVLWFDDNNRFIISENEPAVSSNTSKSSRPSGNNIF